MHEVIAPDGATLRLDGTATAPTHVSFSLATRVDSSDELIPLTLLLGQDIGYYRDMPLLDTFHIASIDELSLLGFPLYVAQLLIDTPLGVPREVVWLAVETPVGLLKTAFNGSDKSEAAHVVSDLGFEIVGNGIVVTSPIVQETRPIEAFHVESYELLILASRLGSPAIVGRTPTNPGKPVTGGQLYGVPDRDEAFLLVTSSALVTVQATSESGASSAKARASQVSVEWN